ncbi:hypothetical protein L596_028131 [Steinernema carpocapsae]|uniref:Uncharacterized protein n=1 Tax=Steinernema carpocapsae TaxID=34508 RepID=A0A4U5LXJ1_STECR|nr:hypothetical protein L596_028131 [Steinernema carpocapsae]
MGSVAAGVSDFEALRKTTSKQIPDWAAVKLASVAQSKKEDRHALQRFARNSTITIEQVKSAVRRILAADGTSSESFENAKQFYKRLIEYRFCPNRDALLRIFVENLINRDVATNKILKEFNEIRAYGSKERKTITEALFLILENACLKGEKQLAKEVLKQLGSPLQKSCLLGCVKLANGEGIEFFDKLKNENRELQKSEIDFICKLAKSLNREAMVISLFELPAHNFSSDKLVEIYGTAVEIAGKKGNKETLEKICGLLKNEQSEHGDFKPVFLKIKHFYKCLNIVMPESFKSLL